MKQVENVMIEYLASNIRTIQDFPKKGISFKDITPLLQNSETLEMTSQLLARPFRGLGIDYVLGLESRGFLFGIPLAQDLHAGFIPVRKPDKLPWSTKQVTYDLEYGQDALEMHDDALTSGSKVVIHDDLIATGGTAAAATRLAVEMGAEIAGYSFVMEISALNGRRALQPDVPVEVLIQV
ncbi:MAG: adenine phosphoribosyltransferase [Balneolaceae bacterium]